MAVSIEVRFPSSPAAKPVKVSVNGITIPRDEIVREMQNHPADKPFVAWLGAARALVVRELLLQRAKALGLTAEPLTQDGRRETEDEALMRGVVEREVLVPEPDDETCRRYYDNNKTRFRSPDIYEASHILFAAPVDDTEARAQARADAEGVLATLQDDPGCFASLARAYSRCPSAEHGGNLGQLTQGQTTPEFERAMLAMTPGEVSSEPIASRFGFHIIRLDRKVEGRTVPYEAVAEQIANYLRDSVMHRAQAQYVARLVSAAEIDGIELAGAAEHRVN
ncbi:peptidylprolyl isomerase [Undibacter mobilis]|uniref:Parvulin-like PPIase n=1 Tax=Undibacter mobilis TaxID=2292256 RepID=A0A371BCN7_9BRAD|nr:peptidylprolyl isomerase [Undibacter mobilis]RDV05385.1 peptidylprolyl isomerase [Undibacter mobilis]